LTVWIDSDSCPAAVREKTTEIVIDLKAEGQDIKAVFTANRPIPLRESPVIIFHQASCEKDSADNYIISQACVGDLVLTKDFLLAQKTVETGIVTMNFDGRVFDGPWLKKRIEERNIMEVLYNSGSVARYRKKSRSDSKNNEFTLSLFREMNKILLKGE
jgi:uncharacterized protein